MTTTNATKIDTDELDNLLSLCISDAIEMHEEITTKNSVNIYNSTESNFNTNLDGKIESKNELSDGTKVEPCLVMHEEKEESKTSNKLPWDKEVIDLFNEKFPNKDIYNMSLDDLKHLRDDVEALREEFSLIELAYKVLSNGAYGASACADAFYFYNLAVAGDITGECRALTKYFWTHLEEFFHETIWERKDLWEKFGFELDENKRELCRSLPVSCYSDTDSVTEGSEIYIRKYVEPTSVQEYSGLKKEIVKITMKDFKKLVVDHYKMRPYMNENGQIIVCVPPTIEVLNIVNGEPIWNEVRYLMYHEVNKPIYTITTESGKSVSVTSDHSCIVVRNGEQKVVKACDIRKETDKIISIT